MLDSSQIMFIDTPETAGRAVEKLQQEPVLGVDIETHALPEFAEEKRGGLDPYLSATRLVSVAALDGRTAVFDVRALGFDVLQPLCAVPWAVFNGGFEHRHLTRAGLALPLLHDVQLLDRLTSHKMYRKLRDVAGDCLQFTMDKTEQVSDWSAAELSDNQLLYAGLDALVTVRAAAELLPAVDSAGQRKLYTAWRDALPVLSGLQLQGQYFDWKSHSALREVWETEKLRLESVLREHLGAELNPNSGKQLAEWLQDNLDKATLKRWPKTPGGQLKTNAETLTLFAELAAIQPLLAYKAVAKLVSTYGASYAKHRHPITGRLHPDFPIGQTLGGRMCANNPNTQNPPRLAEFRKLFAAPEGKTLIGADYGQIELRVAALLSGDEAMLLAYERGDDLHTLTAAAVAGIAPEDVTRHQRTAAKAVNFGNLYGQAAAGLAKTAKLSYGAEMTTQEAQKALDAFHKKYTKLAHWKNCKLVEARQYGKVKTQLGLVRDFNIQGRGYLKGESANIPIQGSAAEILMCTLARLPDALKGLDAQLYHNVHDEIILQAAPGDVDAAAAALKQAMTDGFLDVFPESERLLNGLVDVQTGDNWAAIH